MAVKYIAVTEIQHGYIDAGGRHKRILFKTGAIVSPEVIGVDSLGRLLASGAVREEAVPELEMEFEEE